MGVQGFQKGNPGRPKGATGVLKKSVEEASRRLKINPIEVLLLFAKGDWKALKYDKEKYITNINEHGECEKWTIDPAIRMKAAAEVCQYLYPKLKSVEYVRAEPLSDMTPHQRLDMLKQAVLLLEMQIKSGSSV